MSKELALHTLVQSDKFAKMLPALYGSAYDLEYQRRRYLKLIATHRELFPKADFAKSALFSTAGRSELGGNHTDHNLGKVIAATINLDTIAIATPIESPSITLISEGFPPVEVDLTSLELKEAEKGSTNALVRGLAAAFVERGLTVGGFVANTTTNVLKGSGLSSSAAIEMLVATIFNALYNANRATVVEMAQMAKFAENIYFGKPSGLMDQIACGYGGVVGIDFKDLTITPIAVDFREMGYELVVVDTGSTHADLTDDYASIPLEMRQVASYFSKEFLREVTLEQFLDNLPALRKAIDTDRALLRTYHYLSENIRVDALIQALKENSIQRFLALVNASGESSFAFLQNIYSPHNPEEQGLALALALSKHFLDGDGACRVHGGGFGGTIQAYIPKGQTEDYISFMERVFKKGSVTPLAVRSAPTLCLNKFVEEF